MPAKVTNTISKVDEEDSLLCIESAATNIEIVFDTDLSIFVASNEWKWDIRHKRVYSFVNGRRVELHKMLAERRMTPKQVGYITFINSARPDYRCKNMVIRTRD